MQRWGRFRRGRPFPQGRVQFEQLRAGGPQFRRMVQRGLQARAPGGIQVVVQFCMQPSHFERADHAVATPCAKSFPCSSWRALYNRDFTVFSGMCRISAICA